jgi:hypothetical protein
VRGEVEPERLSEEYCYSIDVVLFRWCSGGLTMSRSDDALVVV